MLGPSLIGEAIACTFFGIAHLGLRIPLGFATLHEPHILPATIVELLCGIVLLVSGIALLIRHPRAWSAAIAAQGLTLFGFIVGVLASGSDDKVNYVFHRVMLVLIVLGLIVSFAMLRRGQGDAHAIEDARAAWSE